MNSKLKILTAAMALASALLSGCGPSYEAIAGTGETIRINANREAVGQAPQSTTARFQIIPCLVTGKGLATGEIRNLPSVFKLDTQTGKSWIYEIRYSPEWSDGWRELTNCDALAK
jgi:hypothetical protein